MKTKKKTAKKKPAATKRTMVTSLNCPDFLFMENPGHNSRWIRADVEMGYVYITTNGSPCFDPDSLDDFIARLQRLAKVVRKEGEKRQ